MAPPRSPHNLERNPVHLGLGAKAVVQPDFTGEMAWYEGYLARHGGDGAEGRLVALHRFSAPWDMWEMHPKGAEVVVCIGGSITLHQEAVDGTLRSVTLNEGDFAINEPGVWHTADVDNPAAVLFITAGLGTQHRPR